MTQWKPKGYSRDEEAERQNNPQAFMKNDSSFSIKVPNELWGENHPANKRWKIKQEQAKAKIEAEPRPEDITNSFNTEDERRRNT